MELSDFITYSENFRGYIENQTFQNESWDFGFSILNVDSLVFTNCTFQGRLHFKNYGSNIHETTDLRFESCKFENQGIIFTSSSFRSIEFTECKSKGLSFNYCHFNFASLIDCKIDGTLRILDSSSQSLMISNDTTNQIKRISLRSADIENLNVISENSIESLRLYDFKNATIKGSIKNISISGNSFLNIKICELENTNFNLVENLQINKCYSGGNITISNLLIKNFKFTECLNSSGITRLNNLKIENAELCDLAISRFYLNQIHFLFSLSIKRCDLFGLKSSYIKWIKGHKLSNSYLDQEMVKNDQTNGTDFQTNLQELQYERDTYRQLKAASFANHNNTEALAFYRNEMHLYWKEIRINGGVNWQDRILVFLNRWVSDFGQSWGLPLMWLAIFHTLLYFCIIDFNFTLDWNAFKSGGGQFFELLNPVHKMPEYIKGFYIGIELLMRILDGFFIYHFIRATRKFAKI